MSVTPVVIAVALVAATAGGRMAPDPCAAATEPLARAAQLADSGDVTAAADVLRAQYAVAPQCVPLAIAAWSLRGWNDALAAGDRGGADGAAAAVTPALDAVAAAGAGSLLDAGYAAALLRAAIASAQDERDEMAVWLEHARDYSRRLALNGPAPRWPLPVDVAEGELWHAVDDFELAERAFTRATASQDTATAAAWRGVARARDRRANKAGACAAYRRAAELASPGSLVAVEARGYRLVCEP